MEKPYHTVLVEKIRQKSFSRKKQGTAWGVMHKTPARPSGFMRHQPLWGIPSERYFSPWGIILAVALLTLLSIFLSLIFFALHLLQQLSDDLINHFRRHKKILREIIGTILHIATVMQQ